MTRGQTKRAHLGRVSLESLVDATPDAMLLVNPAGTIVLANDRAEALFGYLHGELIGQPVELLVPESSRDAHAQYRLDASVRYRRAMGAHDALQARRKDGTSFPAEISLSPLQTTVGRLIAAIVVDISERKRGERALRVSLAEKDALLREVHHRVKNNLAAISSVFYLESTTKEDERMIHLLQEAQDRVRAMAMVHEALYRAPNLSALDFGQYARRLIQYLARTYGLPSGHIVLRSDIDAIVMSVDVAIPCGLILNELLTNSLKHGFPDGRRGEIAVSLTARDGHVVLTVADTGIGIPDDVNLGRTASLGMRLIRSFIRQLQGEFHIRRLAQGTEATASFPHPSTPAGPLEPR